MNLREAIGSSLLLNIVIVIIGIISAFLISSIAYSKAFKAKNRIVSVIEEYGGNCNFSAYGTDSCTKKIEDVLTDMGYSSNISSNCDLNVDTVEGSDVYDAKLVYNGDGGHRFCVYKYTLCDYSRVTGNRKCKDESSVQNYYKVVTFMHFDIPVIGEFLEFGVSGETKSMYDTFVNIKG